MGFYVTDVEKPLASGHELRDKGNTMTFWRGGGEIRSADGARCIALSTRGGTSRMLAHEVASSGLPRLTSGS